MFGKAKSSTNNVYEKLEKYYLENKDKVKELSPDKATELIYIGYTLDTVDFAASKFQVKLDFTDNSIKEVESILNELHKAILQDRPSDEQVLGMSKGFAGYIGETLRNNHDAHWISEQNTHIKKQGPAIVYNDSEFYVVSKVTGRLLKGPEDNIWVIYNVVLGNTKEIRL